MEAPPRFELGHKAFAELCLTTWLWRHMILKVLIQKTQVLCVFCIIWSGRRDSNSRRSPWQGDALPLSHSRITYYYYIHISKKCEWCLRAESNHRHGDFQSPALPTELSGHLAERVGFEPTVPLSITGFQDQLLKPLGHLSTW